MASKKHNPAVTAESEQRRARAVKLRVAGHTYESIARICGYASKSGAFDAVNATLAAETSEVVDALRKMLTAQHMRIVRGNLRRAEQGDDPSVRALQGAQKEIAKLHGLYAPVETKLSGGLGVTLDAIDEARAAARANDPAACSTPPPSPTSPDETTTSAPDSSPTG